MDHLKTLFKVDPEKNALTKWQSEVILAIHEFLSQVNQRVIQDHNLNLSSLMISYISEADNVTNIEDAAQILEHCLTGVGISVSLAPLSTAEALKAQLKQHNVLIVLCTPAYAQRVGEEPLIRELIDEFGKTKNDSLHTLLCVGGFGDTALKVVDGHYLIRSYHGALRGGTSLTSLQTFIDVILSVSGNQGLGLLPDLLDLEKMGRAKARNQYGVLLNDLFNTLQELTSHYRLSQDLEFKIAQNHLKEYFNPDKSLTSSLSTFLNQNTAKTFLFLCSSKADTILTGLRIEQTLLEQGDLALSIDCHDYTAKSAQQSVLLALQHLHFKRLEIDALKQNPIVIIFKNYEQLGAYDNLYVKNQLRQWSKAKILVTCHAEHFQHRDYQSCFLCDPANPQMSSFSVLRVPHFAPPAAEAQTQVLKVKQDMDTAEQESFLHPKTLAIQSEVTNFLRKS